MARRHRDYAYMKKRPWSCPGCNAPLAFEVESVTHFSVNPHTGVIGKRPILYDKWNPMCTPRLYCNRCSKSWRVFHDDNKVTEITPFKGV